MALLTDLQPPEDKQTEAATRDNGKGAVCKNCRNPKRKVLPDEGLCIYCSSALTIVKRSQKAREALRGDPDDPYYLF